MCNCNTNEAKIKATRYETSTGFDVFHWPEFQAFLKRLGVDQEAPTTSISIMVPCEGCVQVVHESRGLDTSKEGK